MIEAASAIVGREFELARAARALEAVERGGMRALGVFGDPGIGKSRLLSEVAALARARGVLVVNARGSELERDLPFSAVADAIEPLISGMPDARPRADLTAVFAPAPGAAAASASAERHRIGRAVRDLLEHVGAERPLAVLLDDLQWADPASADILALLLHRPPRTRVLLALAARSGGASWLERALAAAVRDGTGESFELGPLSLKAVAALLPEFPRLSRERLVHQSGGNPFYLMELARAVAPDWDGEVAAGGVGVPRAVQAALASELASVAADTRLVLEAAAVAGDPFDPAVAAAAAGVGEDDALQAVDDLVAARLIRPTAQPRRFEFRHPLVHRAVYDGAGAGWRLTAHARAARALAGRRESPAQRAHHVARAAQPGDLDAVGVLVAAAEEVSATAPATAAAWYETALRVLPDLPEHEARRGVMLRALAEALTSAGRPLEARDVLRRALEGLGVDQAQQRVQLAEELADVEGLWTANPKQAHRMLVAERAKLADTAPRHVAALTLAMARVRGAAGEHTAAEALATEALLKARLGGDVVLEADAAAHLADASHCALRRDDGEALAIVDRRISDAQALVEALPQAAVAERPQVLLWVGVARMFTGGYAAAAAYADRGLTLSRRSRQAFLAGWFLALRGFADEELGRLAAAQDAAEELLDNAAVTGNRGFAYWGSVLSSWVALARGRTGSALEQGQAAWDALGLDPTSAAGWTVADARLAAGDPDGAVAALDAFGWVNPGLWTRDRLRAVDVSVRVLLALGRLEDAAAWARRAPAEVGGRRTGAFQAIIARAEAGVLLAAGDADEAAARALAGAAAAQAAQAPLWAGHCRTLAGEALAACGRADEARRELRRAAGELERLGAYGYRDAALRALRRLGARPRPLIVPGPVNERLAALSPREQEVAALVGDGHTNAQIAARLRLSERTVEKHVSSVLAKLGLSSRTGVVRLLAGDRS